MPTKRLELSRNSLANRRNPDLNGDVIVTHFEKFEAQSKESKMNSLDKVSDGKLAGDELTYRPSSWIDIPKVFKRESYGLGRDLNNDGRFRPGYSIRTAPRRMEPVRRSSFGKQ